MRAFQKILRQFRLIMKKKTEEKLTIYEYEERYVKARNTRNARAVLWVVAGLLALLLIWCLLSLTLRLWEINEIAGYIAAGVSVLLFVLLYVVPLARICRLGYFRTEVNAASVASAKRHNRRLRRDIAARMVDLGTRVEIVG